MKIKTLIILFLFHLFPVAASAETVYLSAAASMTDAIKEIITDFHVSHPQVKIQTNFGSSGGLAKQIDQGAPGDLYISANPKWVNYLVEKQLIAPKNNRILAYNKLVFLGEKRSSPLTLEKLTELERIAIGSPKSVPAGQYSKQTLEHAKIYTALRQANKLVLAKDVRQALLYADRGEVDGAFVYRTDALMARNAEILFTVPDDYHDRVAYPVGLTASGAKKAAAKALYEYMGTPDAKKVLQQFGFKVED
ncbi:MAG: molybdate ABC transporter substrate-binding protein [Candidatus Electrothrix sp. GW3-4]|uniref:molybdate ABC transporter substrate-binding protein n=1 Tax=Candidatus Electrothrix sp. GW3-4 TaxID=3126740 RepID=UPI0030D5D671